MKNILRRKLRKGISFVAACAIMATNVSPWLVASYASEVPEEAYYEGADEDYEEASEEYFETPEVTMTPEAESADAYFEGSAEPTEAPSEAPDAADEAEYGLEETPDQEEAEVPDYEIDEMEDPDGDGIAEGVEASDEMFEEDAFEEDAFENDASEDDAETPDGQILENAPSVIFEESTEEVRVTVVAGLGVFPEGTTMKVKPAEDEETISKVSESVEDERTKVTGVKAVDVTFYNAEHEEIEPNGPVFVTLEDLTKLKENNAEEPAQKPEEAKAVHVTDEGVCSMMAAASEEDLQYLPMEWEEDQAEDSIKKIEQLNEEATVAFLAESFSTYALVYTVDFEYTVDEQGIISLDFTGYDVAAAPEEGAILYNTEDCDVHVALSMLDEIVRGETETEYDVDANAEIDEGFTFDFDKAEAVNAVGGVGFGEGEIVITADGSVELTDGEKRLEINISGLSALKEEILETTGASIEIIEGNVPLGAEASYTAHTQAETAELVQNYINNEENGDRTVAGYSAADLKIIRNDETLPVEGQFKVTVDKASLVPDGMRLEKLYHIHGDVVEELAFEETEAGLVFELANFSDIVAGYTVEFHNGEEEVSIEGGNQILLSALIEQLKISRADGSPIDVAHVVDVRFSSAHLVAVTEVSGETEVNGEKVDVGEKDFLLTSKAPFTSNEILTIIMDDGEVIGVAVTDNQAGYADLKAASGSDFDISVVTQSNTMTTGDVKYNVETQTYDMKLKLQFKIDTQTIQSQKKFSAVLGDDVTIPESEVGKEHNAYDKTTGEVSFKYKIIKNSDGKYELLIEYQDAYLANVTAKQRKIGLNTLSFDVQIGKEITHQSNTIKFEVVSGYEITVPENIIEKPENANENNDISVSKSNGVYDKDTNRLYFDVVVNTINGTEAGKPISVHDILTNPDSLLIVSDLQVEKVVDVENGNETAVTGYTVNKGNANKEVTVGNLPQLNKGHQYKIRYYYQLDDTIKESADFESTGTNKVRASVDTIHHEDEKSWSVTKSGYGINKSGAYNAETGKINWTITVTNNTANDTVVTDSMLSKLVGVTFTSWSDKEISATTTDGKANTISITSVSATPGKVPVLSGNTLTLGANNTYTITYTTDAELTDPAKAEDINNTAEAGGKTSTGTVQVPAEAKVDKQFMAIADIEGTTQHEVTWRVTIDVPKTGFKKGTTFEDTMNFWQNGDYLSMPGMASFTDSQAQAYQNLLNSYFGGSIDTQYTPAQDYIDQYNNRQSTSAKFLTTFTSDWSNPDYNGKQIVLDYKTTVDTRDLDYNAQDNELSNTFKIGSIGATAKHKFGQKVTKKSFDGNGVAKDVNKEITVTDTADGKHTMSWGIQVYLEQDADSITAVDTLPANVVKVTKVAMGAGGNLGGDMGLVWWGDDGVLHYNAAGDGSAHGVNEWSTYGSGKMKALIPSGSINGKTVTMTVTWDKDHYPNRPDCMKENSYFYFYVEAEVEADFPGFGEKGVDITNNVEVKVDDKPYGSDDHTTHVTYKTDVINKAFNADNWNTESQQHELAYSIDINPNGVDLLQGNPGPIRLDDSITYKKTATYQGEEKEIIFSLKNGSARLLRQVGSEWVPVDISEGWSYTLDEGTTTNNQKTKNIHVTGIPNNEHLKFEYIYVVEAVDVPKGGKVSLGDIKNTAKLTASFEETSEKTTQKDWENVQTDASTESTGALTLVKVKQGNYAVTLGNAYFVLEKYVNGSWVKVDAVGNTNTVQDDNLGVKVYKTEDVTGQDHGTILITDMSEEDYNFERDVLYRLREYKSPKGYVLSSNEDEQPAVYFFFSEDKTFKPDGVEQDGPSSHADNLLFETDTVYLENEAGYVENLRLDKSWLITNVDDPSQNSTEWPEGVTIKVGLYKRTTDGSTVTDTPVAAPTWYSSDQNTDSESWVSEHTLSSAAEASDCEWKHLDPLTNDNEEYVVKEIEIKRSGTDISETGTGEFTKQEVLVNSAVAYMKNVSDNTEIEVNKEWSDGAEKHASDTVTLKLRRYVLTNADDMGMLVIDHIAEGIYEKLPDDFHAIYSFTGVGDDLTSGTNLTVQGYPAAFPVKAGTYDVTVTVDNSGIDKIQHPNRTQVLQEATIRVEIPADGQGTAQFVSVYDDPDVPKYGTLKIEHLFEGLTSADGYTFDYSSSTTTSSGIGVAAGEYEVLVGEYTVTVHVPSTAPDGYIYQSTTPTTATVNVTTDHTSTVTFTSTYESEDRARVFLNIKYPDETGAMKEMGADGPTLTNGNAGYVLEVPKNSKVYLSYGPITEGWFENPGYSVLHWEYSNNYWHWVPDKTEDNASAKNIVIDIGEQDHYCIYIIANHNPIGEYSDYSLSKNALLTLSARKTNSTKKLSASRGVPVLNAAPAVPTTLNAEYRLDDTFTERTVTLTNGNWSEKVTGLPVHDQYGRTYYYAIEEVSNHSGYAVSYSNESNHVITPIPATNRNKALTATNTRTAPQTGNISVTKSWKDISTNDTTPPTGASATLGLYTFANNTETPYPDGERQLTVTLDGTADADPAGSNAYGYEAEAWKATWKNLPKFDASGNQITYVVKEESATPANLTFRTVYAANDAATHAADGQNIENQYTSFRVQKRWLSNGTTWNPDYTVETIYYKLAKTNGTTIELIDTTARTLTASTTINVATANLGDVEALVKEKYPDTDNDGLYTIPFADQISPLPILESGWSYCAVECKSDGTPFTTGVEFWTCNEFNGTVFAIKNDLTDVTAKKEWADKGNAVNHPAITFSLYRTTETVSQWSNESGYTAPSDWGAAVATATIPANATGDALTVKWPDLPKYDLATGKLYTYKVEENVPDGYTLKARGLVGGNLYRFSFENELQTTDLTVEKKWKINGENATEDELKTVPTITYQVWREAYTDSAMTAKVENSAEDITEALKARTTEPITARLPIVTTTGEEPNQTTNFAWTEAVKNLPTTGQRAVVNGSETTYSTVYYKYYIVEEAGDLYLGQTVTEPTGDNYVINNELTRIRVTKKWKLNGVDVPSTELPQGSDGTEIRSITFTLHQYNPVTKESKVYTGDPDHSDGKYTITVTEAGEGSGKTYTWKTLEIKWLPRYASENQKYEYYIIEDAISGHSTTVTKGDEATVVNAAQRIEDGDIVITNSKFTDSLPATGGVGTGIVYGAGAALMLLAVLGLILLNRKRTDGEGIR